jgi:glycosyltransferase involved in cell wall biosynthesis
MATTVVFQRLGDMKAIEVIEELKGRGVKTVFEVDDNMWELPPHNPAKPYWTLPRIKAHEECVKACDRVTTTTRFLADYISKYNSNVVIVPNIVSDDLSDQDFNEANKIFAPRKEHAIVVGWIGSSFHEKDISFFEELVPRLLKEDKRLYFLMMGQHLRGSLSSVSDRVIYLSWVEAISYHRFLLQVPLDIGLAPLVLDTFNRSKSPIKAVEYLYMSAYPICSAIDPYIDLNNMLPDNAKMELVNTNEDFPGSVDDWFEVTMNAVEKIEEIREKARAGRKYVRENLSTGSPGILDIYKSAYYVNE